jgi:hypothetical protein
MSGTNRDNSGSISKNKRKEKDTHPDIRGSATIGGVSYWVSGWQKSNDNGTYYSLSFQAKDEQPATTSATKPKPADLDDDIPF